MTMGVTLCVGQQLAPPQQLRACRSRRQSRVGGSVRASSAHSGSPAPRWDSRLGAGLRCTGSLARSRRQQDSSRQSYGLVAPGGFQGGKRREQALSTQCQALPLGAVAVIANYSAAADRAILTARLIGFAIGALALSIAVQNEEEDDDDIGGGGPGTGVPIPLYVRVDEDRPNYHRDLY